MNKILIIGDSLTDIGTLKSAADVILKKLSNTQKINLKLSKVETLKIETPYSQLCLTNGNVFPTILGQTLNLEFKPSWEFNAFNISSSNLGNNYSCIGARIINPNFTNKLGELIFNHFNLENQVHALIKQNVLNQTDLLIINIGTNDIIFMSHLNENAFLNDLIKTLKLNLNELILNGLKNIIIFELMDLGKIPRFQNDQILALKLTKLSQLFNELLQKMVDEISSNSQLKIIIYKFFSKIEDFKHKFMALNSNHLIMNYCAMDLVAMLNQGIIKLKNNDCFLDNAFFIDDVHLNSWVHKEIAQDLKILIKNL